PPGDFAGQLQLAPRYFAEGPHMSADRRADPLMQAITAQGVRVLLTGDIADAYVGGSRLVFDSLLRQGRLRSFWNHFRTYRRLQPREPLRDTLVESCVAP